MNGEPKAEASLDITVEKGRGVRYNLGCGADHREGFTNVDLPGCPGADLYFDLRGDWTFAPDGTAGFVFSSNLFEHLPDKFHTMNELYRIMAPGARAELHIPSTDGRGAWQDPTHVSFWNKNSWRYWCSNRDAGLTLMNQGNGFRGDFRLVELGEYVIDEQIVMTRVIIEKGEDTNGR